MKTRQIHGLGLGEFLIFAPAKEMLKSAYFFSALRYAPGFSRFSSADVTLTIKTKITEPYIL